MAIESNVLLDEIGRNLLLALQEDARLSYAELGRRIGLSPAATAERLRRLEGAGSSPGRKKSRKNLVVATKGGRVLELGGGGPRARPPPGGHGGAFAAPGGSGDHY